MAAASPSSAGVSPVNLPPDPDNGPRPNGGSDGSHRWRVVVVDDDSDVRNLLEMMFETDGRFRLVASTPDLSDAVELAGRVQPDAVVLDLSSGGAEAWAALPELRRQARQARIVVFSAYPEVVSLLDALEAGADAYLDKASVWELVPIMAELFRNPPAEGPAAP